MIKFLISSVLILFVASCDEFKNKSITSNLDGGIKKVESIVEKKLIQPTKKLKKEQKTKDVIFYHIGDPYFIQGVKYTPEENYNYSEIGLSTYYGKELHNVKTINNDINKVTELVGRHKTLPLPTMVKITNLHNGLSINVKIIDRHEDNSSLIQVSRKVAQLLGFYKDKVATVRIDILPDSSKQWKNVSISLNQPDFNKTISSAPTTSVSISDIDNINNNEDNKLEINKPIELSYEEVREFDLFLKIFKFNNYQDIKSAMDSLNPDLKYTSDKNGIYFDLIIGPVNKNEINKLVSYFISKGYKETKIILN